MTSLPLRERLLVARGAVLFFHFRTPRAGPLLYIISRVATQLSVLCCASRGKRWGEKKWICGSFTAGFYRFSIALLTLFTNSFKMENENKYLPQLLAERDSLDSSFIHAMKLLSAGKHIDHIWFFLTIDLRFVWRFFCSLPVFIEGLDLI